MTSWQRRARLLIGVFAVGFALVVFLAIRDRTEPPRTAPVERADPDAVVESRGAIVIQTKGDRHDFKIEAARRGIYADGSSRFEDVKVTVFERAGRNFEVTGREAKIGPNQSTIEMDGDVRLTSSDGLTVTAQQATYTDAEGLVRVPGPVQFSNDRLSGSGVGATYDQKGDVLWLLDQAHVTIKAEPPAELTAGAAALARRDRYMRFERGVALDHGPQVMEAADFALAYLSEDQQRVERMELHGGARVTGEGADAGALEEMTARDMNLTYADDGRTLERAALAGAAAIRLTEGGGRPGRRIAGEWIDVGLTADGKAVADLTARDKVQVDLPGDRGAPARRIRSTTLEGRGARGGGLTAARFAGDVDYRETKPATKTEPALERIVRARTLDVDVKPGMSEIEQARFDGEVTFRDGQTQGEAGMANYDVVKGIVELLPGGKPAREPHVSDGRISVYASRIQLGLESRRLTGDERVRSELKPQPPRGGKADGRTSRPGEGGAKVPTVLAQDQPVYITSDALAYDEASGLAVYTGQTRLWQGQTRIEGDAITLDERQGNLLVKGSARSWFQLEQTNEKTKARERVNSVARGNELQYDDALRRATYLTDARVTGPQGDLRADRIELYLAEDGKTLERVEAYGNVKLFIDRRSAYGDRLSYFSAEGRYAMGGGPVRIYEDLTTECRETTGRTLTFFRSTDTITVDGNEQRTQTKSVAKCPEPPSH